MSPPTRHTGIVLRRDPAGERHQRLTILDPEDGLVCILHRPATKAGSATVTPDIFDDCEVFLDTPKAGAGASRFAREYRLVRRRSGLAKSYARLTLACRLGTLLADNPHPPDSHATMHALAGAALDALESRPAPEATALKFLYRLARDEGWPVKEHWRAELPDTLADALTVTLTTPLDAIADDTRPAIAELTRRLESWLAREAHYVVRG